MKAVKLLGNKKLKIIEIPKPEPNRGEVVIKVMASGICRTDIELLYNNVKPTNIIPGHEVSGIVDEVNEVKSFKKGDRVMVNCHSTCGKCKHCQNGDLIFCPQLKTIGFDLNGGHVEYMVIPESILRMLPHDITFESSIIISDALGSAYQAVKKVKIRNKSKVGIIGTRNFNDNELKELFSLAREKPFIKNIITHRFRINDAGKAFKIADERKGIKVNLTP